MKKTFLLTLIAAAAMFFYLRRPQEVAQLEIENPRSAERQTKSSDSPKKENALPPVVEKIASPSTPPVSASLPPQQPNQPRLTLDSEGFVWSENGGLAALPYETAAATCSKAGKHLPSIRELATYAQEQRGAAGILSIPIGEDQITEDERIYTIEADDSSDQFSYGRRGYHPPDNEEATSSFWSSSSRATYPSEVYFLEGKTGYLSSGDRGGANGLGRVHCWQGIREAKKRP